MSKILNTLTAVALGCLALSTGLQLGVGLNSEMSRRDMISASVQIDDYCSGTVIDAKAKDPEAKTVVLTAAHCVQKVGQVIPIYIPIYDETGRVVDKKVYLFTVDKMSGVSDLALLSTKADLHIDPVSVMQGFGHFGEDITIMGYPLGGSLALIKGTLGYVDNKDTEHSASNDWQKGYGDIYPGNSGGGVFVQDALGNYALIGTVSLVLKTAMEAGGSTDYYVPVNEIRSFLDAEG